MLITSNFLFKLLCFYRNALFCLYWYFLQLIDFLRELDGVKDSFALTIGIALLLSCRVNI